MNRLRYMQFVMVIVVIPIMCMQNDRMVKFMGDFNVIHIKESHLQFMKAWNAHYQEHKEVVDKGGIVPLFKNVSADALGLVNDALNVGAYKFQEHFNTLSLKDRTLLIKASGQYGDGGKTLMLNIPELTKQLIDVCLPQEVICKYIKKYLDDESDVRNYFREKLICSKRLLGGVLTLKQPMLLTDNNIMISSVMHPSSLFLNAYHTNHCESPIPLSIAGQLHQTYATHFVTDACEYRITDIKDNRCSLWVIDHNHIDNPNYTFSTSIEHQGNIKGCVFSKTGTGVEYAVTFSDCDIVIAKITTQNDISFVELLQFFPLNNGIIVDLCFSHEQTRIIVGVYEGMDSVIRQYNVSGKSLGGAHSSFKKYGLLEKMFIGSNVSKRDILILLFGVAGRYATHLYEHNNVGKKYDFNSCTELKTMDQHNNVHSSVQLLKRNNDIFMYDSSYAPFQAIFEEEQKKSAKNDFFTELSSVARLDSDCYRIYSPDGTFLLCNSLIKKLGIVYVETVLKDAVTHKQIITIDTLYKNFLGLGFSRDGTELIFLNSAGLNYKVSLLNDNDKNMLQEMEKFAFEKLGVTSLLKRLCTECKERGEVALHEDDPARIMLLDWSSKSSMLLKLLIKCLPLCKLIK